MHASLITGVNNTGDACIDGFIYTGDASIKVASSQVHLKEQSVKKQATIIYYFWNMSNKYW
jgi:hypothetical protein